MIAMDPVESADTRKRVGRKLVFHNGIDLVAFKRMPVYVAVPKAKAKAMTSRMIQRRDSGWSHPKGKTDFAMRVSPMTIKIERIINPLATQDVLGFKQAYKNLLLMPRSKIRNGAPMATRIGPHNKAAFARSKGKPQRYTLLEGLTNQLMRVPMAKEPAPIPAR